jgi:2-polyprenyl-6-methoxyphenol hydroxylase-like FAD-dependent oxidoreductase
MSRTGRIGIVGGSIGGCAAAVGLSRLGYEVEVLERTDRDLVGRGAGIATFTALLDWLVARDLIGGDLPRLDGRPTRWVARDPTDPAGRLLGTDPTPSPGSSLTWGDLYAHVRRRVPPGAYEHGRTVREIELGHHRPRLRLGDDRWRQYDLIVCADGHRSLGRSTLFPDVPVRYRGYVLWRGLVPGHVPGRIALLEHGTVRCGYPGGHGVFYLVPSATDGHGGATSINWGLYLQVPERELATMLTDRAGRTSRGSVAAGMLPPDREATLKARLSRWLPSALAEVVDASRDTFIQAIFTATVPAYHRGRVCLVGDAGTLHPPFTGSGVFKAMGNAVELADALATTADVDDALAAWNRRQLRQAAMFGPAAARFEQSLIFSMPDLATLSDDEYQAWNRSVWADGTATRTPGPPPGEGAD